MLYTCCSQFVNRYTDNMKMSDHISTFEIHLFFNSIQHKDAISSNMMQ